MTGSLGSVDTMQITYAAATPPLPASPSRRAIIWPGGREPFFATAASLAPLPHLAEDAAGRGTPSSPLPLPGWGGGGRPGAGAPF